MNGLQGSIMGEMEHTVEALPAMTLCVFERESLMNLQNYRSHKQDPAQAGAKRSYQMERARL